MYLEFHNKLKTLTSEEYIKSFIVYNSSQVIAGVKPASTMTIKKSCKKGYESWKSIGEDFVRSINLEAMELREDENSLIVLVFNRKLLYKVISEEKTKNLLLNLGYKNRVDVTEYLNTLKNRYMINNCPHELGIFLGIPIEDVNDFISCSEKKCLYCGYWKVYNNFDNAIKTFKMFDDIKDYTTDSLIKGVDLKDIVLNIKKDFSMYI